MRLPENEIHVRGLFNRDRFELYMPTHGDHHRSEMGMSENKEIDMLINTGFCSESSCERVDFISWYHRRFSSKCCKGLLYPVIVIVREILLKPIFPVYPVGIVVVHAVNQEIVN